MYNKDDDEHVSCNHLAVDDNARCDVTFFVDSDGDDNDADAKDGGGGAGWGGGAGSSTLLLGDDEDIQYPW